MKIIKSNLKNILNVCKSNKRLFPYSWVNIVSGFFIPLNEFLSLNSLPLDFESLGRLDDVEQIR